MRATPKNILIDLNVVLDVLLERPGFEASVLVLERGLHGSIRPFMSAHLVGTFAYLLEAAKVPRADILTHLHWILDSFAIVPTDASMLHAALASRMTDYEDAIIEQAAIAGSCEAIITRNVADFKRCRVPAMTPAAFVGA